jgi:L-ascorbate metabolism protein UlaG (beta-lactamase superfamily)
MPKVQFLGHSFFRIEFNKRKEKINFLIDPFFGDKAYGWKRLIKCPVSLKKTPKINAILLTHEHLDHFDKEAVEFLAKRDNSLIIAHDSLLSKINAKKTQKISIKPEKPFNFEGISIEAIRTHHPDAFYPLGFKLSDKNNSITHLGDTFLTESFAKIQTDVLLVPVGGTFTLDLIDATRLIKMIKPKKVIPMHYNTFDMIKVRIAELKEKIDESIIDTEVIILKPKQSITI